MGRVHVLDDHLINRIAAGEVVERPASVVKELIENSLDAGAGTLEIAVEGGGKRAIRVVDDGHGMQRDDAILALERHATSKLSRVEDLDQIATLGFRGEALPSIAAVSRFLLRTAPADGAGTEIACRAGTIEAVREVGVPRGTWISVERLFFNVPARRKFLRADGTELAHVVRLVTRYALCRPEVRFQLDHGGRRLIDAPRTEDLAGRIAQLFGPDFARALLPVDSRSGGVRVHGYAGRPPDHLPRRDAQHLYVNGRAVQDRVLAHAIHDAYANTMPRGRHAALVLFVELDAEQVDVNVHPQKTEVRFRNSGQVHDALRDAVSSALSREGFVPSLSDLRPGALPEAAGAAAAAARYLERHGGDGAGAGCGADYPSRPAAAPLGEVREPAPALMREMEGPRPRVAVPLAQYRESYIVAQDGEGLVLVDQHAAHERVLFERYLLDAEERRVKTQRLMFPVTIELRPDERVMLEGEADEFRRLGFEIEPFGGDTVRLDAVPAVASGVDPTTLLRELIGEAARTPSAAAGVSELRRRLVTSAACQAAIKVNHPLTREGMQGLLDDLYVTENPSTCPHGRPALFRLTTDEIERAFRRR